ncbi:EpsG family protein [Salmonella enterica]|nr:EpsG family protein [Salmonella enterica]EBK2973341.1 EpsG family protein [Salmonella enterica]EBR7329302.1 EpsG family protein [Salmonella enterica]EJD0488422.1 EpsG family protein [Salmonella enterica]QWN88036.1 EpsG family protein [Salmonella enterica]
MIPYIIVFLIFASTALLNYDRCKLFYSSMIFLGFACVMRGSDVDRDYKTYVNIYNYIIHGYSYTIEPTFFIISKISYLVAGTPFFIFILYGLLAIYFKAKFIIDWSPYPLLSVIVYFSNVYLLHEMTQIRIGLASAIGFYSLKYLITNEKRKYFICIFVATLFHYSMVIFLFLPLFNVRKISSQYKLFYFILVVLLYFLYLFNIDLSLLIKYIDIGLIQSKYNIYKEQVIDNGTNVNVFSVMQILNLLIILFAMSYSSHFKENRKLILIVKVFSLGPISLIFFSAIPGFALRLSELFTVGQIVLLPMLVKQIRQVKLAYLGVILLSFIILLNNLYYLSLVKAYSI